ncbi:MAG: response regulator [Chloroflexota bacterium]|nr:MAG: response regulator [Chloroflexota bacterium]
MRNKHLLLVEDNPDDVKLTLKVLERSGISNRVEIASDGIEALEYLQGTGKFAGRDTRDLPALVLLDLKMPMISGLEVLQSIRSDERAKLVPVVILTTSNEEKDRIESYELGANSYIRKPVKFSEFTEALQQLGRYWLGLNMPP